MTEEKRGSCSLLFARDGRGELRQIKFYPLRAEGREADNDSGRQTVAGSNDSGRQTAAGSNDSSSQTLAYTLQDHWRIYRSSAQRGPYVTS